MKIKIMSDLHTEFMPDKGRKFAFSVPVDDAEVLVLAGDVGKRENLFNVLTTFCKRFKHVFYVTGNHEYYLDYYKNLHPYLEKVCEKNKNLRWLRPESPVANIEGRRFVGCTLWFPLDKTNYHYEGMINDFRLVPLIRAWVYRVNRESIEAIEKTITPGTVVVTHHLPLLSSVPERFKSSPINRFYVCDLSNLIREKKPMLWIHGHTHDSMDYKFENTRVICNPFGYYNSEVNEKFDPSLVIEV